MECGQSGLQRTSFWDPEAGSRVWPVNSRHGRGGGTPSIAAPRASYAGGFWVSNRNSYGRVASEGSNSGIQARGWAGLPLVGWRHVVLAVKASRAERARQRARTRGRDRCAAAWRVHLGQSRPRPRKRRQTVLIAPSGAWPQQLSEVAAMAHSQSMPASAPTQDPISHDFTRYPLPDRRCVGIP